MTNLEPDFAYLLPSFHPHIALVANGLFPNNRRVLEQIAQATCIIACDGAGAKLNQAQIIPDYIIGDGDSVNSSTKNLAKNPYICIAEQNSNDLTKAISFIEKQLTSEHAVLIFAANGLREDHSLGNISLLLQYAKKFKQLAMVSDFGIFQVCQSGVSHLSCYKGQQISFFCCSAQAIIDCKELLWPLNQHILPYLHSGTLNQATAEHLKIHTSSPILVYRAFEIKT